MTTIRRIAWRLAAVGLAMAFVGEAAYAHGGAGGRGGFSGGGVRAGGYAGGYRAGYVGGYRPAPVYRPAPYVPFVVGAGYYYPWYGTYYGPSFYGPPYYPPAVVGVPVQPPTYIEQGQPPAQASGAPPADGYWYWCAESGAYYPYVQSCTGPWQPVSPQPPAVEGAAAGAAPSSPATPAPAQAAPAPTAPKQ